MTVTREPRVRSVGAQAILLATATGASQVLVALVYLFAARGSTPAEYGQTVVAIALGTAAVGFVDLGTNALWTREVARDHLDRQTLSARILGKLLAAVAVALIALLAFAVWAPQLIPAPAILLASTIGQTLLVPLRARRRGDTVAWLLFTERAVAAVIFTAMIVAQMRVDLALWISLAFGTCGMATIAYFATPRAGRPLARVRPAFPWRGARYYAISAVASSAQQLDLPLLTTVAGATAAGIYGSVNRWTQPMGLLASAFSSAATPFVARANDWGEVRKVVSRAAWLLVIAVVACVALIFMAPWVTPLLLGDAYVGSVSVLQLLAAGTIPAILNQPLAAALQARRYDHLVAFVYLSCVCVQLVLVGVLGGTYGAIGAALAFVILQSVLLGALVCCVTYAQRRDRRRPGMGPRNGNE